MSIGAGRLIHLTRRDHTFYVLGSCKIGARGLKSVHGKLKGNKRERQPITKLLQGNASNGYIGWMGTLVDIVFPLFNQGLKNRPYVVVYIFEHMSSSVLISVCFIFIYSAAVPNFRFFQDMVL